MTLLVMATLAAIAGTDAAHHQIPDGLIGLLLLCGVVHALLDGVVVGGMAGLLICGLPTLLLSLSLKSGFIGGGDIKLCAALGWLFGPVDGLLVMLAAFVALASYGLITHAKNKPIPFAPFVFLAHLALTIFL